MDRINTYSLVIAVALGTAALAGTSAREAQLTPRDDEIQTANDGAFRDGLFVGRLAASRGQASHPLVGRWSSERDRASFAAGYERGYRAFQSAVNGSR